jgi:hypothetical protein
VDIYSLRGARAEIFSCSDARALSSGRPLNFRARRKKIREPDDEGGHAEDATTLLREPCSREIRGENAVACAHQVESPLAKRFWGL